MFVDCAKSHRQTLTPSEQEFLTFIVPIGVYIALQTQQKAQVLRSISNSPGIHSSIVIADILSASQFGTHPVSQKRLEKRAANNLALIETGKYWHGVSASYRGKQYRTYKDVQAYAIDHSDFIALSRNFDELLRESDLDEQIRIYCKNKPAVRAYHVRIKSVIDLYNLTEFDSWPERKRQNLTLL